MVNCVYRRDQQRAKSSHPSFILGYTVRISSCTRESTTWGCARVFVVYPIRFRPCPTPSERAVTLKHVTLTNNSSPCLRCVKKCVEVSAKTTKYNT